MVTGFTISYPRTSAISFVSGELVLLAVAELGEPVLDDVDRPLLGRRRGTRIDDHESFTIGGNVVLETVGGLRLWARVYAGAVVCAKLA